ncbi:MAG: LrgA-associated membrane protein LrgB [uncultured Paraburkholderia sp.]|nr:MAG: LrgA-associated membrane protein LrgB [uncultured Paraburkholderia sp.]
MTALPKLGAIWVYLAASPLLELTITLIAYLIAQTLYAKARFNPLANPVLIAVALLVAVLEITGVAALFGASHQTLASLAPKSATTPIAIAVASEICGIPSLTAVLVISTGVFGAVFARAILNGLKIAEPEVRGFALGIGTARAFQVSEQMGAFAGLGMGLNGVFTAFVVPVVVRWLGG